MQPASTVLSGAARLSFPIVKQDETVRLRVETERYRQPQIAWNVEGTPVSADIILSLEVLAGTFEGRHPKFGPRAR